MTTTRRYANSYLFLSFRYLNPCMTVPEIFHVQVFWAQSPTQFVSCEGDRIGTAKTATDHLHDPL